MAIVFDGKKLVIPLKIELQDKVSKLKSIGISPKLVSFQIGNNQASDIYLGLKKKFANSIGVEMEIKRISEDTEYGDIINTIRLENEKDDVHGVMIQLPIQGEFNRTQKKEIIESITQKKDIDGMLDVSDFTAPVVRAVLIALTESNFKKGHISVVGANGFVGSKIAQKLEDENYDLQSLDIGDNLKKELKESDVIIAATGREGLITGDMVKKGVIAIDVGSPKGEFERSTIEEKAFFITPVPGGIGPLTIYYLFDNLLTQFDFFHY